jgi:hypothetical protein
MYLRSLIDSACHRHRSGLSIFSTDYRPLLQRREMRRVRSVSCRLDADGRKATKKRNETEHGCSRRSATTQDRAVDCPTICTTVVNMAVRQKRSISLPPDLAAAIDAAATAEGTTVSAWIADTAAHRLRLDAGRRGIAEWERDNGPLTATELADGLARARAILGRSSSSRRRAS